MRSKNSKSRRFQGQSIEEMEMWAKLGALAEEILQQYKNR